MPRTFILLMDSFGIGASQDAAKYHDQSADTFGHIADYCATGHADQAGLRQGLLNIPHLCRLGIHLAHLASTGKKIKTVNEQSFDVEASYGYAVEQSHGKDTPSGHWELAGLPVMFDWGYFPPDYPSFPKTLIDDLIQQSHIPGILGNKHASGTDIIAELGEQHIKTGKPIVYTSGDSVFQIAAHEHYFGLEKLYNLCEITRKLVDPYNIGRVIARPFIGEPGNFKRTGNRHDYAIPPHQDTLLDKLKQNNHEVIAIGKIGDIFAHRGITQEIKADGNMALFDAAIKAAKTAPDSSLIFVNFVDFDMLYGHRRDVIGYAHALEQFDARIPEFEKQLKTGDLVIITADHGCDPTYRGTDHTREHIPVLAFGPGISAKFIGRRETMADIGQSIAKHMRIAALDYGVSFL